MKPNTLFSFLALVFLLSGAGCSAAPGSASGSAPYDIAGELVNYKPDTIALFAYDGLQLRVQQSAKIERKGETAAFHLTGEAPYAGIYFLGYTEEGKQQGLPLIVGEDKAFKLKADFSDPFSTIAFEKSPGNEAFREFFRQHDYYQRNIGQARQAVYAQQSSGQTGPALEAAEKTLDSLVAAQNAFYAETAKSKYLTGRAANLYAYDQYNEAKHGKQYKDEKAYFIANFLRFNNADEDAKAFSPIFFEKTISYVFTLMAQMNANYTEVTNGLAAASKNIKPGSEADRQFLLAVMSGAARAQQVRSPYWTDLYLFAAEQFSERFPNAPQTAEIRQNLQKVGSVRIGKPAPDVKLTSPDGKEISLSELKGKVVLIDFWASWCGPCRRENPNVVKVYNAYKDKGFDIFSVSLDKEKQRWVEAIEKDGLVWSSHVSDLAGWQSAPAKLYGVSSIPQTFLVDKNGVIIDKNLRGEELEQRVAELLN